MSKLIDKLNSIYKISVPAIGFRRPKEVVEASPMVLVSSLSKVEIKKAKTSGNNGIDAAIIGSKDIDIKNLTEIAAPESLPLGLMLDDNVDQTVSNELAGSSLDFVVFGLNTAIELVNKENIGKILKIDTTLAPGLVRAVNELDSLVDAVLVNSDTLAVTYERLLNCQLFSNLINKPLLINVDAALTVTELTNLQSAGIKGLILPEGTQSKVFTELRKKINNLPKASKVKSKAGVLLPRISQQPETTVEKVEEDEDEDDV